MNDLISKLQSIGVSGREAEIYIALLQKSDLTAQEIASITSVSYNKVYEVLQGLIKKRMCSENYRNGVKIFNSIEPSIAIQNYFSFYDEDLNNKKNIYKEFEEKLVKLYNDKEKNDNPLDYIEVISDRGQAINRFKNIIENAQEEILCFTKAPYVNNNIEANIEATRKIIQKKVKVKSIYEYYFINNNEEKEEHYDIIRRYNETGEESRVVKELPMKLLVVDNKISMLVLLDKVSFNSGITTIIIRHPSFALTQKAVFNTFWEKALTVEEFGKKEINKNEIISNN